MHREINITAERFRKATGRKPEQGDMDLVNCERVGQAGHTECGWCSTCDGPRFECLGTMCATMKSIRAGRT